MAIIAYFSSGTRSGLFLPASFFKVFQQRVSHTCKTMIKTFLFLKI